MCIRDRTITAQHKIELSTGVLTVNISSKTYGSSICFIATEVYGSSVDPNVLALRSFRDKFLSEFKLGRLFIDWYYKNGFVIAQRIKSRPVVKHLIKSTLNIVVKIIRAIRYV